MSTNQDCVTARLIRYEYGSASELPSNIKFPTPYYLCLVFIKGGVEVKSTFPVKIVIDVKLLGYINKVVERVEEKDRLLIFHFTDGTNIWSS